MAPKYRGVVRSKGNKWSAKIAVEKKTKFLGQFGTAEAAAKAYDKAVRKHRKGARVNFPKDGERGIKDSDRFAKEAGEADEDAAPRRSIGHSQYRGAHPSSDHRKWNARIYHDKKVHILGRFDTEREAALCYDEAVRKFKGSKGRVNFPKDGEKGILHRGIKELKNGWKAAVMVNGKLTQTEVFKTKEAAIGAYSALKALNNDGRPVIQYNGSGDGGGANNPARYRGVARMGTKYKASITVNKKHIALGSFADPESAAKAYDKAVRKHKKGSRVNFPKAGETSVMFATAGGKQVKAGLNPYRGVRLVMKDGTKLWTARIVVKSEEKYLGQFDTPEGAAAAYDKAVMKHRKNGTLNFPTGDRKKKQEARGKKKKNAKKASSPKKAGGKRKRGAKQPAGKRSRSRRGDDGEKIMV